MEKHGADNQPNQPSPGCTYSFWRVLTRVLKTQWLHSTLELWQSKPSQLGKRSPNMVIFKALHLSPTGFKGHRTLQMSASLPGFQWLFDRYSPKSVWRPHDSSDWKGKETVPKFEHGVLGASSILNAIGCQKYGGSQCTWGSLKGGLGKGPLHHCFCSRDSSHG